MNLSCLPLVTGSSFSLSLAGAHPPRCAASLKAAISPVAWCLKEITFNSCYRALFSDLRWPCVHKFSLTAVTGLHMAARVNFDGRQKPVWKNEHRLYCGRAGMSKRMLVNVRFGSIVPWHWDWSVPTVAALTDSGGWPLTQRSQCFSIWRSSHPHISSVHTSWRAFLIPQHSLVPTLFSSRGNKA